MSKLIGKLQRSKPSRNFSGSTAAKFCFLTPNFQTPTTTTEPDTAPYTLKPTTPSPATYAHRQGFGVHYAISLVSNPANIIRNHSDLKPQTLNNPRAPEGTLNPTHPKP